MRFFISILSFTFITSAFGGNIIVTDFDDTIKHTNAASTSGMIWNILMKKKVFSGMPELLNGMKGKAKKMTVLTGSPDLIRGKVEKTLEKAGVKNDELFTKNKKEIKKLQKSGQIPVGTEENSTHLHKIHKLTQILKDNPGDKLILLGDDAGGDPEVYAKIAKMFPGRVEATYIRAIKNRKLPEGMKKFVTAYDIAWLESLAGRFDKKLLPSIFDSIVNAEKFRTTIPNFAHCPTGANIWKEGSYPKEQEFFKYVGHIVGHCRMRDSKDDCAACSK